MSLSEVLECTFLVFAGDPFEWRDRRKPMAQFLTHYLSRFPYYYSFHRLQFLQFRILLYRETLWDEVNDE